MVLPRFPFGRAECVRVRGVCGWTNVHRLNMYVDVEIRGERERNGEKDCTHTHHSRTQSPQCSPTRNPRTARDRSPSVAATTTPTMPPTRWHHLRQRRPLWSCHVPVAAPAAAAHTTNWRSICHWGGTSTLCVACFVNAGERRSSLQREQRA